MKKTFLLGVGAQKAGTSWVYQYLKGHPDCEMGRIKEKTVFSTYFNSYNGKNSTLIKIGTLLRELDRYQWRLRQDKDVDDEGWAERDQYLLDLMDNLAAEQDLRYYLTYFDRLLEANPAVKLIGEITPVYSSLKARELTQIKTLLEGAGYEVKVLFLMRDPVERCFSAIRMGQRRAQEDTQPHKHFAKRAVQDWCRVRTSYEQIIPEIESVFARDKVFLGTYETLFSDGTIKELCKFLGISYVPGDMDRRSNPSPREAEPDAAQLAAVRKFYDPTYAFMAERIGEEELAAIWPHYRRAF